MAVQLGEGPTRGATVVDRRTGSDRFDDDAHPVEVFETVDGPALAQHWLQTLLDAYG